MKGSIAIFYMKVIKLGYPTGVLSRAVMISDKYHILNSKQTLQEKFRHKNYCNLTYKIYVVGFKMMHDYVSVTVDDRNTNSLLLEQEFLLINLIFHRT